MVEFAVGGEGEGVEGDVGGGHHVVGEPAAQGGGRGLGVVFVRGDEVGDESLVAGGVFAELDGGLGDTRLVVEGGVDFAEFDAVAAEFDLVVGAAVVGEVAVVVPVGEVAGAVHAGAGGGAVGVGGEAFGGEGCASVVAAGELFSGEVELSCDAGGYGAQGGVEYVDLGVGEGPSDGDGAVRCVFVYVVVGDVDGGFGGSVGVDDLHVGVLGTPGGEVVGVQCLAAQDEGVGGRSRFRQCGEQGEMTGGGLDESRLCHRLFQARQVDGSAGGEGCPQGGDGEVEGEGECRTVSPFMAV